MTTGGNKNTIGYQTPALWIHNSNKVYIGTTLNGKLEGKEIWTKIHPTDEWIGVVISQVKHGSKYMFSLLMNGEALWFVENTKPMQFSNVHVYASEIIRELEIENMIPGESKQTHTAKVGKR